MNDLITVASGAVPIYGGRRNPIPLWLRGRGVNEWIEITGTSGADNNKIDAWCDFTIKQSTGELLIALAGGHDDDWKTQVSSIVLLDDSPTWKSPRRRDTIPFDQTNYGFPYCLDGVTPSSRHTRYQTLYCPQSDKIMMMGSPSLYASSVSSVESNGFNLATNTWDAPGTWASTPSTAAYGTAMDDMGNIWCRTHKWIRASNTFQALPTSYASTSAFDLVRRQLFSLVVGNGQGYDLPLGVVAKTISEDLSVTLTITFNASTAWTEFSALTLDYSAMTYDPVRDRFLYYYGKGVSQGVVYVITPNASTVWDMSKIEQGLKPLPPLPPSAGTNARFQYVEALDGVVLMPSKASNIYFMRLG